ncbi:hypothetical protein [Marinobacter salarius]|uniref:hypothetical protein n=1 Tax=Marinobacter salarius TaxID=1420917 RepID=UPI0010AB3052|nr:MULTISPECIES: hypothetical protein [Marinobacter]MBJ7302481.1 hypothetical protein [Marinobacter salarius]HIO30768.1 hypothetical protein [Marinobacter salarius]HIP01733.1 hypothetical protein [Marinobacter salarius]
MSTLNIPFLPWFSESSCVTNANDECVFAAVNGQVYRSNSQEDHDTAKLVAAAPDLYNALETLATYAELKGIPANAAQAALAKARGEVA